MIELKNIFSKKEKLISLMMPVYNNEKYIEEAIQSVINQTYSNWELIIVDDGSIDKTKEIVEDYATRDSRIKLIVNKNNLGIPKSRNLALKSAKGEFIGHIDSDDKLIPSALDIVRKAIMKNPKIGLFYSNYYNYDQDMKNIYGIYHAEIFSRKTFKKRIYMSHFTIYNKDLALSLNGFNENLITCEDGEMWLRIALVKDCFHINENLYCYRNNKEGISKKPNILNCEMCDKRSFCNIEKIMEFN